MLKHTLGGAALALLVMVPLAWKWGLGVRRALLVGLGLAAAGGWLVTLLVRAVNLPLAARVGLVWFATLAAAFATLAYRFFRDPERRPPAREDVVVSPADGEVAYVRVSRDGMLPVATKHGRDYALHELTRTQLRTAEAVVVGIGMSFLDVHVNRAPIGGRVTLRRHFPGRFGSLGQPGMVFENERATTVIERGDLEVAVVQIASRLVRQIVGFVGEGQEVAPGQRIGMIRFGSQVDVVLPARGDIRVTVQAGERVRAGESILAILGAGAGSVP